MEFSWKVKKSVIHCRRRQLLVYFTHFQSMSHTFIKSAEFDPFHRIWKITVVHMSSFSRKIFLLFCITFLSPNWESLDRILSSRNPYLQSSAPETKKDAGVDDLKRNDLSLRVSAQSIKPLCGLIRMHSHPKFFLYLNLSYSKVFLCKLVR